MGKGNGVELFVVSYITKCFDQMEKAKGNTNNVGTSLRISNTNIYKYYPLFGKTYVHIYLPERAPPIFLQFVVEYEQLMIKSNHDTQLCAQHKALIRYLAIFRHLF